MGLTPDYWLPTGVGKALLFSVAEGNETSTVCSVVGPYGRRESRP